MKRLAMVGMLAAVLGGCKSAHKQGCTSCGGHASTKGVPAQYGPFAQPGHMCSDGSCGTAVAKSKNKRTSMDAGCMDGSCGMAFAKSNGKRMSMDASMIGSEIIQASYHGGACGPGGACPPGAAGGPGGYGGMMTLSPGAPMGPAGVGASAPPGAVAAIGALTGGGGAFGIPGGVSSSRTSIRFVAPNDMRVSWYSANMPGPAAYDANQLVVPAVYNFPQGAIYRLRISSIPNQGALTFYPTIEVVPANVKTAVFLAHSSVPIAFSDEDFAQIKAGNYLVKVIYLPDPQFQDLATAGPSEIVSTRLEPGADPIAEACRRGSILAVVRVGNIDLEARNTPGMDGSNPMMGGNVVPGSPTFGNPMPQGGLIPPAGMAAPGKLLEPAAMQAISIKK